MTNWNDPNTPCQVCHGDGTVLVEDATGAPTRQQTCPMCGGRGNTLYVGEKREDRLHEWDKRLVWLCFGTFGLILTNGWGPWALSVTVNPLLFLVHLVCWLTAIVGWILWWCNRRPSTRATKHAPGFTTDREKAALGIFGGVAAGRAAWDSYKKKF